MSAFLINKLSFEDTKQIMLSSMKTMASLHGILAIFLPIIAGGGLLTLIMKNVTMEGLAFFYLTASCTHPLPYGYLMPISKLRAKIEYLGRTTQLYRCVSLCIIPDRTNDRNIVVGQIYDCFSGCG